MAGESKLQRGLVYGIFGALLIVSLGWSIIKQRGQNSSFSRDRGDPRDPAEPREIASTLGIDAALLESAPSDPLPPAGDLKEEATRFTTLDACVDEHARIDPLVGDSLRAIGYDTFIRDSCRTLEALHSNAKDKCRPIDAMPLRARCEATVAIATGAPDDCPFLTDESRGDGREPFCVAVASRDPRLCAALGSDDRTRCEATIAKSASACGRSQACKRDVTRIGSLVENVPSPGKPFAPPHALLTIDGENGTESPPVTNADMTLDVARGVVLVKAKDRMIVQVGRLGREEFAPPSLNLRAGVRVSGHEVGVGALERFEIEIPNSTVIIFPGGHVEGAPTLDALEAKRGAPIAFTLDAHMSIAIRNYHAILRVETFVRDVVIDDKIARLAEAEKAPVHPTDEPTHRRDDDRADAKSP